MKKIEYFRQYGIIFYILICSAVPLALLLIFSIIAFVIYKESEIFVFIFVFSLTSIILMTGSICYMNILVVDNGKIVIKRFNKIKMACEIEDIEYVSIENVGKIYVIYMYLKEIKKHGKIYRLTKKKGENIIEVVYSEKFLNRLKEVYSGAIEEQAVI